jgi:hypothetical protein
MSEHPRDHVELEHRLLTLPHVDRAFLPYVFAWVTAGPPSPTLISLIPQPNGTVTATRGDLRQKTEPVLTESGELRIFPDEPSACAWAWQQLRGGLAAAPAYSPDQAREARASGDAQRARIEKLLRGGRH